MLQHRGGHPRLLHRDHRQPRITGCCQKMLDLVNMAGNMDGFIFAALNLDVPAGKALHVRVHGSHNRLTRATAWAPTIPLEQTVDDLLAWWRAQH